ncbi:MAG: metal ABC transporter substrate-binding protein [candidate division WOR-3 bacterium]
MRFWVLLGAVIVSLLFSTCASKENKAIGVVATIPVLADWVKQVGGDRVEVISLLKGQEEPHSYEPSPKDAEKISKARMVVRVGLGLDEWLDGLIKGAQNSTLRIVTIGDGVDLIQEEKAGSGVHQGGNPHIWLDPEVAKIGVKRIAHVLTEADPAGKEFYQARAEAYLRQVDSVQTVLRQLVSGLRNRRFVAMHNTWPYFCRAFGFEMIAAIEPLPGQEPSLQTLATLTQLMRAESVRVIVLEPQHNPDIAQVLAGATGAEIVVLSQFIGILPDTETYLKLLDYNVRTLVRKLSIDR